MLSALCVLVVINFAFRFVQISVELVAIHFPLFPYAIFRRP